MAGTEFGDIKDFQDMVRLLEGHPEWRADLRRLILTDEILNLLGQIARMNSLGTFINFGHSECPSGPSPDGLPGIPPQPI